MKFAAAIATVAALFGSAEAGLEIVGLQNLDLVAVPEQGLKAHEYVNQWRKDNGLQPLAWNQKLVDIGLPHSMYQAKKGYTSHDGWDKRRKATGAGQAYENTAYNRLFRDPAKQAYNNWLMSTGHRQNMLRTGCDKEGIAVVYDTDTKGYWFTEIITN